MIVSVEFYFKTCCMIKCIVTALLYNLTFLNQTLHFLFLSQNRLVNRSASASPNQQGFRVVSRSASPNNQGFRVVSRSASPNNQGFRVISRPNTPSQGMVLVSSGATPISKPRPIVVSRSTTPVNQWSSANPTNK